MKQLSGKFTTFYPLNILEFIIRFLVSSCIMLTDSYLTQIENIGTVTVETYLSSSKSVMIITSLGVIMQTLLWSGVEEICR